MSVYKLLVLVLPWFLASAWRVSRQNQARRTAGLGFAIRQRYESSSVLLLSSKTRTDEEEADWREFRARLVLGEQKKASNTTSSWAYESGYVIEEGTVLLSSVEQDFGYGLKQQYFHKCVVLIIYHDNSTFTKGILLNRPTNLTLTDADFVYKDGTPLEDLNCSSPSRWRMWYGGEVQGLGSDNPEIVCLHSLSSEEAREVSENVMKSISWTTMEGARRLVSEGEATSDDFLVFCGYAGWSSGQLMDELERDCWYTVATDSPTIWEELQASAKNESSQMLGINTWERLMKRIGRGDQVDTGTAEFDDKMLREWGQANLFFDNNGIVMWQSTLQQPSIGSTEVTVGSLLRGSPAEHSPFLLSNQEFHKSIVLVTQDEPEFAIGVLLNRPLPEMIELVIPDDDGQTRTVTIPERYGGRFGVKGDTEKRTFWFHNSKRLRVAGIGSPLGEHSGIWKCSRQDVCKALKAGDASAKDFIAVTGFNVWPKGMTIGKFQQQ